MFRSAKERQAFEEGPAIQSQTISETTRPLPLGRSHDYWFDAFRRIVRLRHCFYQTENTYLDWIRCFASQYPKQDLATLGEEQIKGYLDDLAVHHMLSLSSQRQALNALVFFFREVMGKQLGDFSDYTKAQIYTHLLKKPGLGVVSPMDTI